MTDFQQAPATPEDLGSDYAKRSGIRTVDTESAEMESFMASAKDKPVAEAPIPETADPARNPAPPPKPLRQKTEDAIGRIPVSEKDQKGGVSRNIAEIPGAVVGGVESAIKNSLGWMIDPLADWLNTNVADLSYDRSKPHTVTGEVTKSVSEFLTGFIPAVKKLKALGITGKAINPMAAGAIADFAVRDPAEKRLGDLWNQLDLPKNVLTDYLAHPKEGDPKELELEGRLKNALEGVGLGTAMEGIFMGIRLIRAAKNVKGVAEQETAYLKDKYGEIDDATFNRIIGDPSKPSVEMVVHEPSPAAGKIAQGAADTEKLAPRSVIRNKAKPITEESVYASLPTVDRGVRYEGKLYRASGDETHIAAVQRLQKELGEIKIDPSKMETGIITPDGKFLTHAENNSGKFGLFKDNTGGVDRGALVDEVKRRQSKTLDFDVYINFAKFDEPDQIKFTIGKLAEAGKGTIDEATRGVITQIETQKLADNLGMSVTELLARRKGQTFNAEEAVAARQLWAASGERLVELAKKASSKEASALDEYTFRNQMAIHSAIQAEVIGARTEGARSLAAWKIPVKGGIERARAIDQILNAMGGAPTHKEMARRIAILAEVNADPAAIAKFAERGAGATSMDAVREAWINGLLSAPKTHAVNIMSNTMVALSSIAERQAASVIRGITGGEGVHPGEAIAMTYGMISSIRDAWMMAAKAIRTGETSWTFNKVDLPQSHAISAEAFGQSKNTVAGQFVDYLGSAARVPTRLLGAEDEFFKTIGYRMELHAQALRTAASEGHVGEALGQRVAEIVRNPPEHIMINSSDAALYNTFTNEVGQFGKAIMNLRNIDSAANPLTFILPFVRTPVNIARFAFERTPFAFMVSQWRADVAAGGARADLALARMSTGTMAMMTAMDLADKGHISGPGFRGGHDTATNEAATRQGWMPYSVKIGDRWYSYNRADPFGMTLGFAASIAEAVKKGEVSQDEVDEWQEVTAMSIAAVSQVVVSKTYLEGFAKFVEVLSDPKRYSQKYIDDLFASFVPMTSLMSGVKNIVDPVSREQNSPKDAVMARIAGLSENLPPRRDLWGKEITASSGFGAGYDFVSPIVSKKIEPSTIDREMVRMDHGVERIQKRTNFDGVDANFRFYPKAYDDYVRLAGNDLKHPAWGVGAKDFLNSVAEGKHPMSAVYNLMSDESRKAFIQNTIQDYRKLAQQQVLNDPKHKNFSSEIKMLKEFRQMAKMPVMGEQQ